MIELVTPNKVIQFCTDILKDSCISKPTPISIKPNELNPDWFYVEGGTSNIAIGLNKRKIPVVLLKNGFWMHFNISFTRRNSSNGNSHSFQGISLQIFKESNHELTLLFRAEWDNKQESEFEHPQPHWHFHPQVEFSIDGIYVDHDSFKTYLEILDQDNFENTLAGKSEIKQNNISSFHFAMSSRWQENKSAVIALTETNLKNWLTLILQHINLQLQYSFS